MTDALHSHGTTISIKRLDLANGGAGADADFLLIRETRTIGGPSATADQVDVSHTTAADMFREYIANLLDGGEITVDLNFVPASTTDDTGDPKVIGTKDLLAQEGLENDFLISWPDGKFWECHGMISAYSTGADREGELTLSLTIKVIGPVDFAYTPPP